MQKLSVRWRENMAFILKERLHMSLVACLFPAAGNIESGVAEVSSSDRIGVFMRSRRRRMDSEDGLNGVAAVENPLLGMNQIGGIGQTAPPDYPKNFTSSRY
jgi:hypothetical protein